MTALRGSVPVAWRQLRSEPAKAFAAAVALVLLLLLVEPAHAVTLEATGQTLYFCATGCRDEYAGRQAEPIPIYHHGVYSGEGREGE